MLASFPGCFHYVEENLNWTHNGNGHGMMLILRMHFLQSFQEQLSRLECDSERVTGETQRRADEEIQEVEERGERDEGEEGEEEERNGGEHPNKSNEGDGTAEEEAEAAEGMEHDGQVKSSEINSQLSKNTIPGIHRSPNSASPRKTAWSYTETENLLKGVRKFGVGKWAKILGHFEFASHRTSVSLKDKWRNLNSRKSS